MRLNYAEEKDTTYAEAWDQEYDGYLHETLLYAEIDKALGGVMVRWESDYKNPVHFTTIEEAKIYVEKNHTRFKPTSIGKKFSLEDEE